MPAVAGDDIARVTGRLRYVGDPALYAASGRTKGAAVRRSPSAAAQSNRRSPAPGVRPAAPSASAVAARGRSNSVVRHRVLRRRRGGSAERRRRCGDDSSSARPALSIVAPRSQPPGTERDQGEVDQRGQRDPGSPDHIVQVNHHHGPPAVWCPAAWCTTDRRGRPLFPGMVGSGRLGGIGRGRISGIAVIGPSVPGPARGHLEAQRAGLDPRRLPGPSVRFLVAGGCSPANCDGTAAVRPCEPAGAISPTASTDARYL